MVNIIAHLSGSDGLDHRRFVIFSTLQIPPVIFRRYIASFCYLSCLANSLPDTELETVCAAIRSDQA